MRIVHIVPGSGDSFYCENCVRDVAIVRALRAQGHDVIVVPMYLPMFMDDPGISGDVPVFFGGINTYLQHNYRVFRKTPRWFDRVFDSSWMLRRAAQRAGTVRASSLGEMTLSMIRGDDGRQEKELRRLTEWLSRTDRPDIIHVSNALLLGVGCRLRQHLGVPLACTLQDEDVWIDAMGAPYAERCWDAMRERAACVDAFVAVSSYFSDVMCARLTLDHHRIHVMHIGFDATGIEPTELKFKPPVIGYLARMSEEQGLGTLVDAFLLLVERGLLPNVRLRVSGGKTADDDAFLATVKQRLADNGAIDAVEFVPRFDKQHRAQFLSSLSVFSVPLRRGGAYGTYLLEAMAAGVPVVQPCVGAFPEIVRATGGGMLYEPNTSDRLAKALESVLLDQVHAVELGKKGRASIRGDFSVEKMAANLIGVYEGLEEQAE